MKAVQGSKDFFKTDSYCSRVHGLAFRPHAKIAQHCGQVTGRRTIDRQHVDCKRTYSKIPLSKLRRIKKDLSGIMRRRRFVPAGTLNLTLILVRPVRLNNLRHCDVFYYTNQTQVVVVQGFLPPQTDKPSIYYINADVKLAYSTSVEYSRLIRAWLN